MCSVLNPTEKVRCRQSTALIRHGFTTVDPILSPGDIRHLLAALEQVGPRPGVSQRAQVYAIRNLLEVFPAVRELADSGPVRSLVEPVLGSGACPVQGIFFDKPPDANWKVPWHQDLSIPVKARVPVTGFGPWSMKAGVPHVQPPTEVLERLLIVRLHLDDCTEESGPLRVIPGSHLGGKLTPSQVEAWRARAAEVACLVPRGGALVMRPLLLHASSAARASDHRRVIHLVFAAEPLPGELDWPAGRGTLQREPESQT
jgi:ectoine hydroxylase-related dioxygenase (phytanoyl-CoA dioxygenase family)